MGGRTSRQHAAEVPDSYLIVTIARNQTHKRSGTLCSVGGWLNQLYYGDNLYVLRKQIDSESVDLVYLDLPFNSNRNYNVVFARHGGANGAAAQIQAFDDTWHWTPLTDQQYQRFVLAGSCPQKWPTLCRRSARCLARTTPWPTW